MGPPWPGAQSGRGPRVATAGLGPWQPCPQCGLAGLGADPLHLALALLRPVGLVTASRRPGPRQLPVHGRGWRAPAWHTPRRVPHCDTPPPRILPQAVAPFPAPSWSTTRRTSVSPSSCLSVWPTSRVQGASGRRAAPQGLVGCRDQATAFCSLPGGGGRCTQSPSPLLAPVWSRLVVRTPGACHSPLWAQCPRW